MNRTTKVLNLIYCLTVMLFLLDSLTSFDIKNQAIKTSVYIGFLIETPIILFWNSLSIKPIVKQVIGGTYPAIFLVLIFIINPIHVLFQSGAWQTQTILYQNKNLSYKKVEFQMQGIGALGYNRRSVEVTYLTPLFMITREIPSDIGKRAEWIRVDKDVNELGLKSP